MSETYLMVNRYGAYKFIRFESASLAKIVQFKKRLLEADSKRRKGHSLKVDVYKKVEEDSIGKGDN